MSMHALLSLGAVFLAHGDLKHARSDFSTAVAQGMSAPSTINGSELNESARPDVLALSDSLASLANKRLRRVPSDNEEEAYYQLTAEWLERMNIFLKVHCARPDHIRQAMIKDALYFAGINGAKRPMEFYRFLQRFSDNRSFVGQDQTLTYQ